MIVPIETSVAGGVAAGGSASTQAELSMDLYERGGAYVAEVYLGRCDDRALRIEAERAEVALVGSGGNALMRLRFREPIDTEGVTALLGSDLLTITMPKRAGRSTGGSDLRGWMR